MDSRIHDDIDQLPFELLNNLQQFFHLYKASKINLKPFVPDEFYNDTCVICTEKFKKNEQVCDLKCKHAFHKECIIKWSKRKMNCPLCKKPLYISKKKETLELSISLLIDL